MLLSRALVAVGLFLVACGGESESGSSTGGGTSTGGKAGSGGTATGGASSGGSGNSAGTGAASGSGGAGGGGGTITGGSGGTSGSAGTPGSGGAPCAELEKAYKSLLPAAKACNLAVSSLQCTKGVPDDLYCPCGATYVNPSNPASAQLDEIATQYSKQNCPPVPCPEIACPNVTGGMCGPDPNGGTNGTCVDQFG